ncbi:MULTISPECIES: phosphoribosyltransferase [Haloarcula]|uniref:phosphoribosyltransferase n=1 Tax=Haloarcula TaxID=2237 RepID=UPI0023EE1F44|nr:phosphoribosyltransferase family protein [Halomicroarcula sp. XH51]
MATHQFTDRSEAGEQLGAALRERDVDVDLVLAIPRGGLPLGRAVADALGVPLDVVVAKKIGAPHNPEYALGAVASDGSVWRNESALRQVDPGEEYFEREREKEAENARRKAERYRQGGSEPDVRGKAVVVVDDGVATGSTARACLELLRQNGADRLVLAIPVGPPDTVAELGQLADAVVCLWTPQHFSGVGQFYDRFDQVSDEAAIAYLDQGGV